MRFSGAHDIELGQDVVWSSLRDVDVLAASIPGCESFERVESDTETYKSIVATTVGPMKARFTGSMEILDSDPPNSYKLVGSGSAGSAGAAKGEIIISLQAVDSAVTKLSFDASVAVTGRMAQIGGKMINSTAEAFANEFFQNLTKNATAAEGELEKAAAFEVSISKKQWLAIALIAGLIVAAIVTLL